MTLEEVIEKLKLVNQHFNKGIFKVLEKVPGNNVVVETEFGLHICYIPTLLNGSKPTIKSAIDKTSYAINQFKIAHGDKYDYSEFKFTSSKCKTTVICREHGPYETDHSTHKQGFGCMKCAVQDRVLDVKELLKRVSNREKLSSLTLLGKEGVVHMKQKGKFFCSVCREESTKKIVDFVNGNGCYNCAKYRLYDKFVGLKKSISIYTYLMYSPKYNFYKIGISNNVKRRVNELSREIGDRVIIKYEAIHADVDSAKDFESRIIKHYREFRYHHRSNFGGVTECFTINPLELEELEYKYEKQNYYS